LSDMISHRNRILSGYFEVEDLDKFLYTLYNSYRGRFDVIKKVLDETFSHDIVCERILSLIFKEPSELSNVLKKYSLLINRVGTPLLKSFAILSLIDESMIGERVDIKRIISSLIETHPLISLYNPLVIGYISFFYNTYFHKELIEPIRSKTTLYEFNPLVINTILYRDLMIYSGLGIDKKIYEILYEKYGLENIEVIFVKISSTFNEEYSSLILNSYIRVVKGVLESIRAIIRGLSSINSMLPKVRDVEIIKVFMRHLELTGSFARENLRGYFRILDGLISVSRDDVREAILRTIDSLLDHELIVRSNMYDLLVYMLELDLFIETCSRVEIDMDLDLDEYIEVIDTYALTVINKLKEKIDIIHNILGCNVEPYKTLKERVMGRSESRYLSWLRG